MLIDSCNEFPNLQSRDTTPISDYMRQQDQILLNRILQEGDAMASLKTMAQDVLDRTGLNLGDSSKCILELMLRFHPLIILMMV